MAQGNALNNPLLDSTGTGQFVGDTSPTIASANLTTPSLGVPASGTLTNCTGLPISSGVDGLGANVSTWLGTPSSANLLSAMTDETGTGALVFGTAPTIDTASLTDPSTDTLTVTVAAGLTINSLKPVVTVKQQTFTASGTYTPSTGMLFAQVICIGAGGGSGGVSTTGGGQTSCSGGGGGGAYSYSLLDATAVGASQTVTIGAGGAAGAAGINAGGAGTDTSVGVLVIAKAGLGGDGSGVIGEPFCGDHTGAGGAASAGTGDTKISGEAGSIGIALKKDSVIGSAGGGNTLYPANRPTECNVVAAAGAANTGNGAYGGAQNENTAQAAGAVGGSGIIIITEFCNQ